jgi:hypothetical protein
MEIRHGDDDDNGDDDEKGDDDDNNDYDNHSSDAFPRMKLNKISLK